MSFFFRKSGIVNVKMVITEEKILSNIDKIQKLINPNSKKQIIELDDDSYFRDLVESIKTYLIEYPQKKNFPRSVYKAAYELVEYSTNQFEENTKNIENLIRKRERNIKLASILSEITNVVKSRAKNWKEIVKKIEKKYPSDVIEALNIIGKSKDKESEEYTSAIKLIEAKINNLEANLHIGIDIERIEDRSKALSYIGIEIAEALKFIPTPIDSIVEQAEATPAVNNIMNPIISTEETVNTISDSVDTSIGVTNIVANSDTDATDTVEPNIYFEETRFESKVSLWQRIKNSKLVRAVQYVMKIRVVLEYPALPEGRGENY